MKGNEYFLNLVDIATKNNKIDTTFYEKTNMKRGLRNSDGTGVVVGLTKVGDVKGYDTVDGKIVPADGKLYYRNIDVEEIVKGVEEDHRKGFEEATFLLLFGKLPTKDELKYFNELLDEFRKLPLGFTENMILKFPSQSVMNKLQRSVLVLYSHDENPDDNSIQNVLVQSLKLIARFPTIIAYGYQSKAHNFYNKSLYIHPFKKGVGTAENILHMIRPDNKYSKIEAETLDLSMLLHAEHGGGNNSTFATHVVSSSGTDTYSAISSAVGSLKGFKHGGANIKVKMMVDDIKENISNYSDKNVLKDYLYKIIKKEAFDRTGLIYGMGHAVYTLSDPRAVLLKKKAQELAIEIGNEKLYNLYADIDSLTVEIFKELRGADFNITSNVDLYSGFVYEMLNIPIDLYTPIFAASRVSGWCAHRIEQILSDQKILRPAYNTVVAENSYLPLNLRK